MRKIAILVLTLLMLSCSKEDDSIYNPGPDIIGYYCSEYSASISVSGDGSCTNNKWIFRGRWESRTDVSKLIEPDCTKNILGHKIECSPIYK